jgi:hypothetical protein
LSNHPLNIEIGRHRNVVKINRTSPWYWGWISIYIEMSTVQQLKEKYLKKYYYYKAKLCI